MQSGIVAITKTQLHSEFLVTCNRQKNTTSIFCTACPTQHHRECGIWSCRRLGIYGYGDLQRITGHNLTHITYNVENPISFKMGKETGIIKEKPQNIERTHKQGEGGTQTPNPKGPRQIDHR